MLLTSFQQTLHLIGRQAQRVAHLQASRGIILEVGHLLALGFQLLWRVEGDISLAIVQQLLDILAVDVAALALLVGAIVASLAHTLVNADAQPLQSLVDIFLGTRNKAGRVGVLDAQDHRAAMLAGKQVVIQRSAHTPDVERACG